MIASAIIASAGSMIGSASSQAATELAKVNNSVIFLEEFNKRYQETIRFSPLKHPSKKAFLDEMIKRELAIQEAKHMGLEKDPEIIDRTNSVLYHALIEKKLSKEFENIRITDDEAKSYYEKNPEIRTSHIMVALPLDAKPDVQRKALEKIKKILSDYKKDEGKMSFAEYAQRFSEGPTADQGGDIQYQTRDRLDPAYYEAALKLKTPGNVSDIIRSSFGYHIIKLTGIRGWDETDQGLVKRMVFEERRAKLFEKYMAQLRSNARTQVRADLLKE
jgi:peptidyl-prolyl cis-trans isomerase C/peptidyl-prolyl cis-trans isomerase D